MRRLGGRPLWLGNAGDLRDARPILDAGITAVVELADCEQYAVLPRELIRSRFPLSDGGDNPAWLLRMAAETVANLIINGVAVLVCCSAGMSRSLCVAAAGIALAEGMPFAEALRTVAESGPADVSPGLAHQFQRALNAESVSAGREDRR